jgi:hypothetical protein
MARFVSTVYQMRILPGLFSEGEVVERFKGEPYKGVTIRMVRERARAKNLGRKIGHTRYFTEEEILALWGLAPSIGKTISAHARVRG